MLNESALDMQCLSTGVTHIRLTLQENALLGRIETNVEALLARTFESYYSLKDDTPTGILEGGEPAPEQPAPALVPAVQLAGNPADTCSFPMRNIVDHEDSIPLVDLHTICKLYSNAVTMVR